jgi:osmotically-inducible protein OsmY
MRGVAVFFLIALGPISILVSAQTSLPDVSSSTAAFSEDSRFARVTITKQSGLIILRGTVQSCKDKREALKEAFSLDGVQQVEDHVEVKTNSVADQSLNRDIAQSLKNHNFRTVRFRVSNGVVTLRGMVPSDSDREQVVNLICGTSGVVDVDDHRVRVLAHASSK